MPNVLDCARLSFIVYDPSDKKSNGIYNSSITLLRKNWDNITSQISKTMLRNSPFYAELWLNKKGTEAMVGFRGTEITVLENDIVDASTWWKDVLHHDGYDKVPKYFTEARWFVHNAKAYLQKNAPKAKLYFTGHSLGGAIAKLMTVLAKNPRHAISFNGPGVGHIHGVDERYGGFIHNINSRYGYINKIGKVLGSVNYVDVKAGERAAATVYQTYDDMTMHMKEDQHLSPISFKLMYNQYKEHLDEKIIVLDFSRSVYPQHSMNNLLHALTIGNGKNLGLKVFL